MGCSESLTTGVTGIAARSRAIAAFTPIFTSVRTPHKHYLGRRKVGHIRSCKSKLELLFLFENLKDIKHKLFNLYDASTFGYRLLLLLTFTLASSHGMRYATVPSILHKYAERHVFTTPFTFPGFHCRKF